MVSKKQRCRAQFRVRFGEEATMMQVRELEQARRKLGFFNIRTLFDTMILVGVPRSGGITCDHFEAMMTALSLVDRKKGAEADDACDPWSIWRAAWKFGDHRLK